MNKKRGLLVLSILLLSILVGCGGTSEQPSVPLQTTDSPSDFVQSLPNIRDAINSAFGSLNIYFNDFVTEFDGTKTIMSPDLNAVPAIDMKANAAKEALNNLELIVSDFGKKKSATNVNRLSGTNANLVKDIDSKLSTYANNKAKISSCVTNMEKYAEFVELTAKREKAIADFTRNMEQAGNKIDANQFDSAISLGTSAKQNVLELQALDKKRSDSGIVPISSDVLQSWDLHLQAMNILLSLWQDLKADDLNSAMEKANTHYNTFTRANEYGAKEAPVQDQANAANIWLKSNVGVCKGLLI